MRRLATTFLGGMDTHGCLLGALHLRFSFFSRARQPVRLPPHHSQRGKRGQYATQTEALGLPLLEISTTLPLTSKVRCGFPPCSCQVRVSESQLHKRRLARAAPRAIARDGRPTFCPRSATVFPDRLSHSRPALSRCRAQRCASARRTPQS